MLKKLPASIQNWISVIGLTIALISFLMALALLVLTSFLGHGGVYLGLVIYIILPAVMVCGFALVALGMLLKRRRDRKQGGAKTLEWPRFDLVLLGMGTDGHIASIFPGEITEGELGSPVIVTKANYQGRPGERVSLTPLVFNSAKHVYFLVAGKNKAKALRAVLNEKRDPVEMPASRIHPREGEITWFVDKDAASLLDKDLL